MKKIALAVAFAAATITPAMAQETDMVCLITFGTAEEAAAGADADALSCVYLTRDEAMAQAAASGGVAAVFDYSTQYSSNEEEGAFCEGSTFNPDDDGDDDGEGKGAEPNPNSAKSFAPGQVKGEDESARAHAPGQQEGAAKDSAPGQQKKNAGNGD